MNTMLSALGLAGSIAAVTVLTFGLQFAVVALIARAERKAAEKAAWDLDAGEPGDEPTRANRRLAAGDAGDVDAAPSSRESSLDASAR